MGVAHRASAAHSTANPTTAFDVTIPASVQDGDDLYLEVISRGHLGSDPYPTVVDDDTGGNTWTRIAEATTNRKHTLWYKKATSGTASKVISVTGCVNSSSGEVNAYSGAAAGDPTTNITSSQNTSGTESVAGFTPDNADSMICLSISNVAVITPASESTTDPGALTQRQVASSTGGSDCSIAHSSALQSGGPTATGNFTWSQTDGVTGTIRWAIKPAAGGGQVNVSTSAAGAGAATISANARRALSALAAGVATAAATIAASRGLSTQATGSSSASAAANVRRGLGISAAGLAQTVAALNARRALTVTAAGVATTSADLQRFVVSSTASAAGTSTVTVTLTARRALSAAPAGVATSTADLRTRRSLSVGPTGQATAAAGLAPGLRNIRATAAGIAAVVVTIETQVVPSIFTGKYAAEHAAALADVRDAAAADYAGEHAAALADIGLAGL